jgi:cell division protease FtsH
MAKDKVLMGSERRSLTLSDQERRVTAFHEAGHALVALCEEHHDPLHKVSIIPRGRALGVTMAMPAEDRYTATKEQLLASVAFCMGGRAAEDVVFEQFSTGASDDLVKATKIAREMVCSYGMSEKLGPMSVEESDHPVFLGREIGQGPQHSQQTAIVIDQEVQRILSECYEHARGRISERRDLLDKIAHGLLERETLDNLELAVLVEGGELPPLELTAESTESSPETSEAKTGDAPEPRFGDKTIPEPEPMPG